MYLYMHTWHDKISVAVCTLEITGPNVCGTIKNEAQPLKNPLPMASHSLTLTPQDLPSFMGGPAHFKLCYTLHEIMAKVMQIVAKQK